jgi:hypothetical protein
LRHRIWQTVAKSVGRPPWALPWRKKRARDPTLTRRRGPAFNA